MSGERDKTRVFWGLGVTWMMGHMRTLCILITGLIVAVGCTPTVKVATDEPITINLNVNIKHEILIKVDKDLDNVFSKDSGLF